MGDKFAFAYEVAVEDFVEDERANDEHFARSYERKLSRLLEIFLIIFKNIEREIVVVFQQYK